MASTTPTTEPRPRSTSRTRRPPTRPTTPLRPPSRTSLRTSTTTPSGPATSSTTSVSTATPLDALEPQFAELSDSLADLEANMMHLQLLHESVARFNENFASFLYGLNMSAFCVDFPEAPRGEEVFRRYAARQREGDGGEGMMGGGGGLGTPRTGRRGGDETFLTSDTSFVNDPPASVRTVRHAAPPAAGGRGGTMGKGMVGRGRGGIPTRGSTGASRAGASAGRGSGISRGRVRGAR